MQAKRARGFRNMQQRIQPRARWGPTVWVGLIYNFYNYIVDKHTILSLSFLVIVLSYIFYYYLLFLPFIICTYSYFYTSLFLHVFYFSHFLVFTLSHVYTLLFLNFFICSTRPGYCTYYYTFPVFTIIPLLGCCTFHVPVSYFSQVKTYLISIMVIIKYNHFSLVSSDTYHLDPLLLW